MDHLQLLQIQQLLLPIRALAYCYRRSSRRAPLNRCLLATFAVEPKITRCVVLRGERAAEAVLLDAKKLAADVRSLNV
jgi:hypothetical protein